MSRITRPSCSVLLCAALLGGCSGGVELPGTTQGAVSTTRITGTVTATADGAQFVTVPPGGLASLSSFLFGPAHAAIIGLTPVAGAVVELVRLADGAVIATDITDEAGVYTFSDAPALGSTLAYIVRVNGDSATLRALVSGEIVDISPASEVVAGAVLDGAASFANFEIQEAAALAGLLASMDVDVSGMDFTTAIATIRDAAGGILPDMVAGFSTPGAVTSLRGNDYSVINYSALLRDPLVVPVEGAPGGVDIRSGQGMMIYGFGDRDAPTLALLSEGAFIHDFSAIEAPGAENDDAFPFLPDLTDLLHVPNAQGQLLVADRRRPSISVAGVGALTEGGDYLVYPLDTGVLVDGDPSIFLMGLRYGARWRSAGESLSPVLDLTLLDEAGGAGTVYNHMRLQQTLNAPGAGSNGVRLTTEVGTVTFDSTPRFENFDGQSAEVGSFEVSSLTDSLSLDLSSYLIDAANGAGNRQGFYFIPAGGGMVQFRDDLGAMLGWGATSTDGLRDGEVLGGQMFSGGFDVPVISAERSFSIAIRRATDMTAAALTGTYNLVEYGGYVANDVEGELPRGYVETGIRYGTVHLDGLSGIASGPIVRKVARIDVAAARGETGAVPNASGESGAFETATPGEAGETFSLTVGGTQVFVSDGSVEPVTAADIQEAIDIVAPTSLAADGIEVSGSVVDGDLVFTKTNGEPFDIVVVNGFTGTAIVAGGFEGEDFSAGTNTIDDRGGSGAIDAVATVSPPAGAFADAISTEAGQTYSMTVGGVEVFEFTSTAAGELVTAAQVQAGITGKAGDLEAAGIGFTGSAESGDLVFSREDGADFEIVIVNEFSNTALGAGGFAGEDFVAGDPHTIEGGSAALPNETDPSGEFQTLTSGDVDETYSMIVGGVEVFSFTSTAAEQTVTAADIQAGVFARQNELDAAGIVSTGSAETGDLVFRKDDGTPFAIEVENTFLTPSGGFAGVHFATGSRIIEGGQPATASASDFSGTFTTATAGGSGEEFRLEVAGVTVYAFTSTAAGDTVEAGDVQGGIDAAIGALEDEKIAVSGSVAGGDLVFTRTDGRSFVIQVTNTFSGIQGAEGGFANLAGGTHLFDSGTEAEDAVANASNPSGAFETGVAGGPDEVWTMSVGGIEVFSFTSTEEGDTVSAADIQAGIEGATAALNDAGFTVSGTATGGDLVFAKDDGTPFDIVIVSGFTGEVSAAGGFEGEDFAAGERTIDNGSVAGVAPSLASISEQQALSFGSYSVSAQGVVTLTLDIGNETITGEGAVTQDGDFAAVVTGSTTPDDSRSGRSILFLIRQPD